MIELDSDSFSYLTWNPVRSSAYPLFLQLANGPLLLPLQLLLLAMAISWVSRQAERWFDSIVLAGLLAVGLSINPYIWQLQAMVMSEALTTPLLVVMLGAALGYLVKGGRLLIVLTGAAAGLAAAARPSCLPLVLVPLLTIMLRQRSSAGERLRQSLLILAFWGSIVIADRMITHVVHGDRTTSLAGRHLYAKAALVDGAPIDRGEFDPLERSLLSLLERQYAPVRAVLRAAPAGRVRDALRLHYEVCIQYTCTEAMLHAPLPQEHILDQARLRVGLARLRQRPLDVLALAWEEYRGMWQLHPTDHPDNAAAINAFVAHHPLPFPAQMSRAGFPVPAAEQRGYYRLTRPAFRIVAVAMAVLFSVLGIAVVRGWRHPLLIAAFIAAASVQAVLVLGAFAGVGIPRYMMGMWPAIVFASACSIVFVTFRISLAKRTRRRHVSSGGNRLEGLLSGQLQEDQARKPRCTPPR